jgi:hypothetical protein
VLIPILLLCADSNGLATYSPGDTSRIQLRLTGCPPSLSLMVLHLLLLLFIYLLIAIMSDLHASVMFTRVYMVLPASAGNI